MERGEEDRERGGAEERKDEKTGIAQGVDDRRDRAREGAEARERDRAGVPRRRAARRRKVCVPDTEQGVMEPLCGGFGSLLLTVYPSPCEFVAFVFEC